MNKKINDILRDSAYVRELFYGDGHVCEDVETCNYNNYISDNKSNIEVLTNIMESRGIKLIVSPTGSGKSVSLVEVAKGLTKKDKSCKVYIALPSRPLTLQLGNQNKITKMVGGDIFDTTSQITVTTYEKMFEIKDFIDIQKSNGSTDKNILILDESHLLTTQHVFRNEAIHRMIRCIEKNYFDSVLLVTATPSPMSLFRCNKIICFESKNYKPVMDKIEIIAVDDPMEYIKNMDYSKCFPFIRLNSKDRIDSLIKDMPQKMVRITADDKKSIFYNDIVDHSRINGTGVDGILTTSVLEAGVSVKEYPENIIPVVAFVDNKISADDIEQFLNRVRKNGKSHVGCAKVIVKKPKERELKAVLVSGDGQMLCEFQNLELKDTNFIIHDIILMDAVPDGKYILKLEMGSVKESLNFSVTSTGKTNAYKYSKTDAKPVVFSNIGFRPFTYILERNYNRAKKYQSVYECYVDSLHEAREKMRQAGISNRELAMMELEDEAIVRKMTMAGIDEAKDLKDCLSYCEGKVEINKRSLYMICYQKFQSQYYFNHELLREELEARMGIPVTLTEESTGKGKCQTKVVDIWDGMEDLRENLLCKDGVCDAIAGDSSKKYRYTRDQREIIEELAEQKHIVELIQKLKKFGMSGEMILEVLTRSKTNRKVNKYKNAFSMIARNRMLDRLESMDIKDIPDYGGKNDRLQKAVYCYLEQKKQVSYVVTDKLAKEIEEFYKESFPLVSNPPTVGQIKSIMKKMYKLKDKNKIKSDLILDEKAIFRMVESDYK